MDFNEMKEIKDKKNEIENIKKTIQNNLKQINDSVIYNQFYYIIDDINNNCVINSDSLLSVFDWCEPLYKESRNYIENNIKFINILIDDGILFDKGIKNIGNDFKQIFKNINVLLNVYIVRNLDFNYDNIDIDDYNISINDINDFDDYYEYLDSIYDFYDSLNDCIGFFMNKYKDYIL